MISSIKNERCMFQSQVLCCFFVLKLLGNRVVASGVKGDDDYRGLRLTGGPWPFQPHREPCLTDSMQTPNRALLHVLLRLNEQINLANLNIQTQKDAKSLIQHPFWVLPLLALEYIYKYIQNYAEIPVLASIFEKTVGYVLSERKQFGKKLDVYHYIGCIVS